MNNSQSSSRFSSKIGGEFQFVDSGIELEWSSME
jgi:hypothetical protein